MTDFKKPTIPGKQRDSWTNEAKIPTTMIKRDRESWSGESPDVSSLTIQDLNSILEVNQRALTIYLEVEQQNKDMIELISENTLNIKTLQEYNAKFEAIQVIQNTILKAVISNQESFESMKKNIEELDRNFFRLMLVLGSAGIGTIVGFIQMLVKK